MSSEQDEINRQIANKANQLSRLNKSLAKRKANGTPADESVGAKKRSKKPLTEHQLQENIDQVKNEIDQLKGRRAPSSRGPAPGRVVTSKCGTSSSADQASDAPVGKYEKSHTQTKTVSVAVERTVSKSWVDADGVHHSESTKVTQTGTQACSQMTSMLFERGFFGGVGADLGITKERLEDPKFDRTFRIEQSRVLWPEAGYDPNHRPMLAWAFKHVDKPWDEAWPLYLAELEASRFQLDEEAPLNFGDQPYYLPISEKDNRLRRRNPDLLKMMMRRVEAAGRIFPFVGHHYTDLDFLLDESPIRLEFHHLDDAAATIPNFLNIDPDGFSKNPGQDLMFLGADVLRYLNHQAKFRFPDVVHPFKISQGGELDRLRWITQCCKVSYFENRKFDEFEEYLYQAHLYGRFMRNSPVVPPDVNPIIYSAPQAGYLLSNAGRQFDTYPTFISSQHDHYKSNYGGKAVNVRLYVWAYGKERPLMLPELLWIHLAKATKQEPDFAQKYLRSEVEQKHGVTDGERFFVAEFLGGPMKINAEILERREFHELADHLEIHGLLKE